MMVGKVNFANLNVRSLEVSVVLTDTRLTLSEVIVRFSHVFAAKGGMARHVMFVHLGFTQTTEIVLRTLYLTVIQLLTVMAAVIALKMRSFHALIVSLTGLAITAILAREISTGLFHRLITLLTDVYYLLTAVKTMAFS